MYMDVPCVQDSQSPEEGVGSKTGVTSGCEQLCGCWELNPILYSALTAKSVLLSQEGFGRGREWIPAKKKKLFGSFLR